MLQNLGIIFKKRLFKVKLKDETTNLREIEAGVRQASILGPVLHRIYTSDLPTSDNTTTATFADDTVILAKHDDPEIASMKLQDNFNRISEWAKKWTIKVNQNKSTHFSFTLRNRTCPTVQMDSVPLSQ
jgi:hypothetical protein